MSGADGAGAVWRTPEVTSIGRLPMGAPLDPHPDAASARAGDGSRWVRVLDGTWDFQLLDSPRFDRPPRRGWSTIEVPGTWVLQGGPGHRWGTPAYTNVVMPFPDEPPGVPERNPTGLHRVRFDLTGEWAGRRTLLEVGSADSFVRVIVNGVEIGCSTDSRLAATFDVTAAVRPGVNEVVLAVARWSAGSWLEDQDQWWLPGLHRSVRLVSVGPVAVADAALVPGLAADLTTGLLDVDVTVDLGPAPAPGWTVAVAVETLGGRRIGGLAPTPVPVFEHGHPLTELLAGMFWTGPRVRGRIEVPGIEPWNHERPTRYRAVVTLADPDGAVAEVRAQVLGFRSVEVGGNELRINGAPVRIVGVNRHEFDPDRGRTVDEASMRRDLATMKAHHVNAVRCAHYPDDPRWLDLCDEYGMYVVDEANVETHARQASLCDDPRFATAIVERGMRMVQRDRNHPCVIAWSLGNESGDGAAHAALAAWIRRTDPSRPLHYEGPLMHDLYADAPVTDIVCPMYTPVDELVAWARSGRDRRRPLILCEFSHAMGNAGGLDDYVAAFDAHHGLQGGFIWEWRDHGLRRPDGSFAYGGDFGEPVHDANFCCDGLVGPDGDPHPLLGEYAALNEPVAVERVGRHLRITNRRWFSGLDDLRARWIRTVDGVVVDRGTLDLGEVAPQGSVTVPVPGGPVPSPGRAPGECHVTVELVPRRRPAWAPPGWVAARRQVLLVEPARSGAGAAESGAGTVVAATVAGVGRGIEVDGTAVRVAAGGDGPWIDAPELSLWRAPTDNDGLRTGWMAGIGARGRWIGWGLDRLEVVDRTVRRRGGTLTRTTVWAGADPASTVRHRQRISVVADGLCFDEDVEVPPHVDDLPRVGVAFRLPVAFDRLSWFGPGPGDSYPDRRAMTVGRWSSTVEDQYVPFVMPQAHGHHVDTRWVELSTGSRRDGALRIEADRRFGWSASRFDDQALGRALHTTDLVPLDATLVHVDVAHRGLGSAACGPDTAARHLVRGGRHRWRWTLSRR